LPTIAKRDLGGLAQRQKNGLKKRSLAASILAHDDVEAFAIVNLQASIASKILNID
jgi:hypothetical protein